ncbi:hypothetical protein FACS1894139_08180 [Planctomycetales bacterium]|nr:hypothetical protein FACS1894107_00080 [Planctomycetales bacterium]GHS96303.1 hypothetical protein FACS1894108_00700 [Planctomycetales bacterium]GHT05035.1 hypothetical protein FACS1894139_08180 [Planctomycetales bacterium]
MSKTISDHYQLKDQTGETADWTLFNAEQILAGKVTRAVVIKIYKDSLATERQEECLAAVADLVALGDQSVCNRVFDFGVDEKLGVWAAMERAVGTLASFDATKPASPRVVRQVLGQILQALQVMHRHVPALIYHRVSPRNIWQLPDGGWALNGAMLGGAAALWKVLGEDGAKYAAPEVLDAEQGEITAASDIYSLGFAVCEFALGKKLFDEQFAKNSHKTTGKSSDQWMYWHVSPQLTLPSVKKLLPDFPADLSDALEKMTAKNPAERTADAGLLLEKINWVAADKTVLRGEKKEVKKSAPLRAAAIALIIVFGLALLGGTGYGVYQHYFNRPELELDSIALQTASDQQVITGKLVNFPEGGQLVITTRNNLVVGRVPARIVFNQENYRAEAFKATLATPILGEYLGRVVLTDSRNNPLITREFVVTRRPPATVKIQLDTFPTASDGDITITSTGDRNKEKPTELKTDAEGNAEITLPYGDYVLNLKHPAFLPFRRAFGTGITPTNELVLNLLPLSHQEMQAVRRQARENYEKLKRQCADGDQSACDEMAAAQRDLDRLGTDDKTEVVEQDYLSKRLGELRERQARGETNEALRKELAAAERLQELRAKKARGELTAEEAAELATAERLQELREKRMRGELTPAEAAELAALESGTGGERVVLKTPVVEAADGFSQTSLNLTPQEIMSLSLSELKPHIQSLLPRKAVTVTENAATNKLDVNGATLDEASKELLLARLTPAMPRLTVDLRVDPNLLVRDLRRDLVERQYEGVTVHPFLNEPAPRLYIGAPEKYGETDLKTLTRAGAQYVATSKWLVVENFPDKQ